MRPVFVDTSAFFALIVPEDPNHNRAYELFLRARRERWRLVTTNAVLFETHALLLNRSRPGRETALRFLDAIKSDRYRLVRVQRSDENLAIALIKAQRDKAYSMCDALSFVVMERLGIGGALSFDRDFRSYGRFEIL